MDGLIDPVAPGVRNIESFAMGELQVFFQGLGETVFPGKLFGGFLTLKTDPGIIDRFAVIIDPVSDEV